MDISKPIESKLKDVFTKHDLGKMLMSPATSNIKYCMCIILWYVKTHTCKVNNTFNKLSHLVYMKGPISLVGSMNKLMMKYLGKSWSRILNKYNAREQRKTEISYINVNNKWVVIQVNKYADRTML